MPLRVDPKPALPKVSELVESKASHLHRDDISHEKRERFFQHDMKKKSEKQSETRREIDSDASRDKDNKENKRDRDKEEEKEDDAERLARIKKSMEDHTYHIDIKI